MPLIHVTDEGQAITDVLTIAAGVVTILHPADPSKPVTIPGYVQASVPIPLAGQFFINYASGIVSFNAANSGTVSVTYTSLGENVNAAYINGLIDTVNSGLTPQVIRHAFTVSGGGAVHEVITPTLAPNAIASWPYVINGAGALMTTVPVVDSTDAATVAIGERAYISAGTIVIDVNGGILADGNYTVVMRSLH